MAWDLQHCGMCDKQSLRSACANANSPGSDEMPTYAAIHLCIQCKAKYTYLFTFIRNEALNYFNDA